jgi:hypothetical protein
MFNKLLFLTAMTVAVHSCAQTSEPIGAQLQWGVSGGANHYSEPDLMELEGPEIGLHLRVKRWAEMPSLQLEGGVLYGQHKYTSLRAGSMSGVPSLETRWQVLAPVFGDSSTSSDFFAGIALHTLWNDLRGTTSFQGATYKGYRRESAQLWMPVRWVNGDVWEIDVGLLVYGQHLSRLSDVGSGYRDVVNTQRRGQYAQVAMNLAMASGEILKPFVRYTQLGESDSVTMGGANWVEPKSQRLQVGVVWVF